MATDIMDLKARADQLRKLHSGQMLVLPNAWDAASAAIVAEAGFPAVATASAAISAISQRIRETWRSPRISRGH